MSTTALPDRSVARSAPERARAGLRLAGFVRRRRHAASSFDRFYRVYVSALLGGLLVYTVLRSEPTPAPSDLIAAVDRWGFEVLTIAIAIVWVFALRAGQRGAPLAIEAPEVQHVLLAPIDHKLYLRNQLGRLLRLSLIAAIVLAALSGEVTSRHLPGGHLEWMTAALALWVALLPASVLLSVLANGMRAPRPVTALAVGLLALALIDIVVSVPMSPSGIAAAHVMRPMQPDWVALAFWPIAVALLVGGWVTVHRISLPAAERRSHLVAQLRFAMAQQDIRNLVLIRRQLAAEEPLAQPRLRFGGLRRWPTLQRNAHSQLRWPNTQLVRVMLFGIVSTVAVVATVTTDLWALPIAGVANYLIGLETAEPLVQEFDHPLILALAPIDRRSVMAHHLVGAALPLELIMVVAAVVVALVAGIGAGLVALIAAPIAAVAAAAAAALSIRPLPADGAMELPEMTAPKVLLRLGLPPATATIGLLALTNATTGQPVADAIGRAMPLTLVSIATAAAVALWLILRDEMTERTGAKPATSGARS